MKRSKTIRSLLLVLFSGTLLAGCASLKSPRLVELNKQVARLEERLAKEEKSKAELAELLKEREAQMNQAQERWSREAERLADEKAQAVRSVEERKSQEANELVEAQRRLAQSLKQELGQAKAKLAMTERGLVLTFLNEVFFDSGKAALKEEGVGTLEKVVPVLRETVPNAQVAIEGHTDNEPIRYSGWKSNWELSAARALAVVHHFVDQAELDPKRLQAVGFGEHHPVASNETAAGRHQNRRVEVVILPSALKKVKAE